MSGTGCTRNDDDGGEDDATCGLTCEVRIAHTDGKVDVGGNDGDGVDDDTRGLAYEHRMTATDDNGDAEGADGDATGKLSYAVRMTDLDGNCHDRCGYDDVTRSGMRTSYGRY